MQVKNIMGKKAVFISPKMTIQEAAQKMKNEDVGFLPVGENDKLIGVLTDRDITLRAVVKGDGCCSQTVKDFMTKDVEYCFEEDDIKKAAEMMGQKQLHRLIVLNKDKRFTGVLSLGDLATKAHDEELCGEVCHKICQGIK